MENLKKEILQAARKAHDLVSEVKDKWPSSDPIKIEPYHGYASGNRIFLTGRVLEDDNILVGKSYEELKRIIYSFKRFETDELPGVRVQIRIGEHTYERRTDEEGYFTLDIVKPEELLITHGKWLDGYAELPDLIGENGPICAEFKLMVPPENALFGVISDIDDTLLQTHVTSLFQLKMMFVTLFKEAGERLAMEGMVELYQEMAKVKGVSANPFFYVSNSPWNIYPQLREFLSINKLPSGPLLLRDIGLPPADLPKEYRGHKIETISRILDTYPEMKFVLFGDTGSKDADVYLTLAKEFSGQIKTIYIRHLKDTQNARRVAVLIREQTHVDVLLIQSTADIVADAREKGYVNPGFTIPPGEE